MSQHIDAKSSTSSMPATRAEKLQDVKNLLRSAFAQAIEVIHTGIQNQESEYQHAQYLALDLHRVYRDTLNLMRASDEDNILQEEHINTYLRKRLQVADLKFLVHPDMKDDANERLETEWLYLDQINQEIKDGFMDLKESIRAGKRVPPQSEYERLMSRLETAEEFLNLDARLTIR